MDRLNLSDNIIRLRRERKITQEELADFLGVTKASVSKWENAQSVPDIMLLLQMAAFFDITIDGLIGYDPRLTQEQIRRFYAELVRDFADGPFSEAVEKART
ncbi:MAG: helix-turn-helix domain-containing protein, partial [Lachnospiraceae bacterium]|nr:helix-turn-helix domain-containing protein [Lachnospiraceae bacterium]